MQNEKVVSSQDSLVCNNYNKVNDSRSNDANHPSSLNKNRKSHIIKEILQCRNCRSSKKLCILHENSEKELIDHLISSFKTFNKTRVIQELSQVLEVHQAIHLKISTKIRYLSRKFELPGFLLPSILRDLKDPSIDLNVRINLAQAVKYGVRNHLEFGYDELFELLKEDSAEVKSEILWALGYKIKNSAEGLTNELIERINVKITSDMTPEAKAFLKNQIAQHNFTMNEQVWQENYDSMVILSQNSKRKPQTIVTKNQQIVKGKYQHMESQESKIEISGIIGALKSQQKRKIIPVIQDKLPKEQKESFGSDCSWFGGTYTSAKTLYDRANQGFIIKDQDKDEYLTDKFLTGQKYWASGILGELLTDRMIAATFNKISRRQRLTAGSLDKLILCLEDLEYLMKFYCKIEDRGSLVQVMLKSWVPELPNDLEKRLTEGINSIKKRGSKSKREVEDLFETEIALIRVDAMSAIYNCALRDRNVLTHYHLKKIEDCLEDKDQKMRAFAVKILGTLNDSQGIHYMRVFETCLRHLEENVEPRLSLDYIYQQSKDINRCQILFTKEVVFRLSKLLKSSFYDYEFKIDCIEVLINNLEHSLTKGLEIKVLENFSSVFQNDGERDKLKEKALMFILLTAEKERELPDPIISSLVKNIEYLNDHQTNLVLIILGTICDQKDVKIPCIERISPRLLDDRVIIGKTVDSSSSKNSSETMISTVVGKIIMSHLKQGNQLSSQVVFDLIKALASCRNKQTRILAAKAISFASDSHLIDFNRDFLIKLEDYVTDEIPDVAIYITNAFTEIYRVLIFREEILISSGHMEILASVYADQELRFDEKDFSLKINKNILSILAYQASRQIFSESILSIFDYIFLSDDSHKEEALLVIRIYTENQKRIPESTVLAIENVLGKPELASLALNVLEKVIENEQIVSDRTLKIFADRLFLNNQEEEDGKNRSFKVLEIADNNQDLADNIFEVLELERAGLAVELGISNFEDELKFLGIETQAGRRLPSNVIKALSKQVKNSQVLSILVNVSTNGQLLPEFLIHELNKIFVPKEKRKQLVQIFFNLAKNNQDIPKDLLEKLERMVTKHTFADQIILFFTYQAQKGEKLSHNIMRSICEKILTTENQSLKQECLSAICSILQTDGDITQLPFEEVLVNCLHDANEHIVLASLDGFSFLCSTCINHDSIEALVKKAAQPTCQNDLKQKIILLLDLKSLTDDQANLLKLITLNCEADFKLLNELSKKGNLLEQNFQQINKVINESFTLQKAVIDMLVHYPNKNEIPEYLIDSIATLMFRTSLMELRSQCLLLIGEIVKSGRILSKKAVSLVSALQDINEVLRLIEKNQAIPEDADLLLQIEAMPADSVKSRRWADLLKKVIAQLDCGFQLTKTAIKKLVELAEKDDENYLQEFALIFSRTLLQDSQYLGNVKIVEIIEKAIKVKKINLSIIQAYRKIIRSQKCQKLIESLDIFLEFFSKKQYEEEDYMISLEIFSCITDAAVFEDFCEKGLQLMEKNISNSDVRIRRKCFQGLQARKRWGDSSEIFEEYCHDLLADLECCAETEFKFDYDLLETLASVEYLDFVKLKRIPQEDWIRELLLSDLLARFQVNEGDFYKEWLETEDYLESQGLDSNKLLKNLAYNQNFTLVQLDEVLKFLPNVDLNKANNILLESLSPFEELKQNWLISLLMKYLENQQVNQGYIHSLASNMSSKLATPVISKLFIAISKVDKLMEFESLINFVVENNIRSSDIEIEDASVHDIKRSLEIKILVDGIQSPISCFKFEMILENLFGHGWSFEQLNEMFKKVESYSAKEENFLQVLESLSYYKIPITSNERILEILDGKGEEWTKKVNEVAIDTNFQANTQVKNHVELISELKSLNLDYFSLQNSVEKNFVQCLVQIKDSHLKSCIDFKHHASIVEKVLASFNLEIITKLKDPISEWTKSEVFSWAKIMKSSDMKNLNNSEFLIEALAVIKRANFLYTGFNLTDAQILSCLVQLNANSTQGRLLQVGTGEGKSTIVSVIAIIHALKGKKVDIITSSPVLAERDAREKVGLYKMFDLSCADNDDKSIYSYGPKSCYKQDIVYGEIAQFQFDTLRDKFSMLGTLAGRECEVAIIDEVDSMLIDDSSNIARLSSTIAGMDMLQPLIHFLWQRLNLLQQRLVVESGRNYLLCDQAIQVPNLKEFINNLEDLKKIAVEIEEDVETFLKKELEKYLREDLLKKKQITVPKNFEEFVDIQISKWIDNAIRALMSQEDQQYVIQDGVIKPVAYDSTGIVQSATSWGDGLHQLIQRKHGLKMTSETCTTNFLSNIGFIKKYGCNLFGLTGTLGSKRAKEVLSGVYNVDLVQIPLLHKKQYLELPVIICHDHNQWLEEICDSAIYEANKDRGVLIICQTIEHCKIVAHKLGQKHRAGAIKLYTMNNMNQERDIDKINPGEIIVATNLAGRGTDIKTENIEINGGLHVIVSFLPPNQRVEDQAFGRTARQGKRGTGQMILDRAALLQYNDASSQEMKKLRDQFESAMFDEFMKKDLEMVTTKDRLFTEFCKLLKKIREEMKVKKTSWQKLKDRGPSAYETNMLNAVEERWALFLHKIENEIIPLNKSDKAYDCFKSEILQDFSQEKLIKNPYYHIRIANDLLTNSSFFESQYDQALENLERAIRLDPQHSVAAFVGKAVLAIKTKNKKKTQITEDLRKALELASDEMACLNSVQVLLQQEYPKMECDLSRQLIEKAAILGSYMNSIQNALTVIKKSQRLIDVTGFSSTKVISNFYDLERDEKTKEVQLEFGNHDKFTVVFHDLTKSYEESGNRDQAIATILNAPERLQESSESRLKSLFNKTTKLFKGFFQDSSAQNLPVYKDLAVALSELNHGKVKELFDPDIQIFDVNKETALLELEKSKWKSCKQVNLENVLDGKVDKSRTKLTAQDAIKIIKGSNNVKEMFNIIFKDVNETAKTLKEEILKSSILTFEFSNLSCKTAKDKLSKIKPKFLNIEISGNKVEICKALMNSNIRNVQLFDNEVIKVVEIDKAREVINKMKESQIWIKIEDLSRETAEQTINICASASFQLTLIGVNPLNVLENLEEEEFINVNFTKLSSVVARKLIPILRGAYLDFTLEFHDLTAEQLKDVIKNASLEQEDLEITNIKKLNELFPENARPNLELAEFAARGIEHFFEINEKRFIPWRSVITVAAVGSLQIALGGLLIATGFGASSGMGLITEGAADYITAYRAYRRRHFTWSDYTKQKAVSLAISAVSVGAGRLKDGFKGINTVISGIEREAIEQAGAQVLMNSQSLKTALITTTKSLQKLSMHQVAVTTSEVFIREGLNNVSGSLVNFTLEKFKPEVSSFIQKKVEMKFSEEGSLRILIQKMHALDKIRNSEALSIQIKKIAQDVISSEKSQKSDMWDSIGMPLCQGVLSGNNIGVNLNILKTLSGLTQISLMIDKFHSEFVKKLSEIDKNELSIQYILHQHCNIPLEEARKIYEILKAQGFVVKNLDCEYLNAEQEKNMKLGEIDFGKHKEAVLKFCEDVHKHSLTNNMNEIMKLISDIITEKIIRVTESHLISPWSACMVGEFTNNISANVQNHLIHGQLNQDSYLLSKRFKKKIRKEYKNENKLATYTDLINHQANRHTMTYTQCENVYYTQQRKLNIQNGNLTTKIPRKKERDQAQREREQMAQRKESKRDFKNVAGTVIKITVIITKAGEIILKENGAEANPRLSSILTAVKIVRITAVGLDMANEIIFSAFENDILSGEFLFDILNQIEKNKLTIYEAATCLKLKCFEGILPVLKKLEVPARKLRMIYDMIKICQKLKSGKIDLLKVILDIDKNQLFKKKEWRRYFRDSLGIVKKILARMMKALKFILEANGGASNPALSFIFKIANSARKAAIDFDQVFEMINSGLEKGVFSPQFLTNVINQIGKIDFSKLETPSCVRLRSIEKVFLRVKKLKIPTQKLMKIKKMMRIYQKIKNRRGNLTKAIFDCFSQELQDPKILSQIYQFFSKEKEEILLENEDQVGIVEGDEKGKTQKEASILGL